MLSLKDGDRVRIAARSATSADLKSGLYYNYYANLSGAVFKIYGSGETTQIAVDVDLDCLPEDIAKRHLAVRDEMRSNLTGEAKRLSAPGAEQEFRLRYVVLVAASDLSRKAAASVAANATVNTAVSVAANGMN